MNAVIKLLAIIAELINSFFKQREIARREQEIEAIRNDPAGEFINEFGGVRVDDSKADVSGGQAGVEVFNKE